MAECLVCFGENCRCRACDKVRLNRGGHGPMLTPPPHTCSLVTPSRTDRQPPNTSSETKGGLSAVGPDETKQPDSVTDNKGTTHG